MRDLSQLSDHELLAQVGRLAIAERECMAELIEHLVEVDRRKLYLGAACSSLSCYCVERLGHSEDEAGKRVRVAKLADRFPQVVDELRAGTIHLTGLCLLAQHMNADNYAELLVQARCKSKRAIESLLAARFPRPGVPDALQPLAEQGSLGAVIRPGTEAAPGFDHAREQERNGAADPLAAASRPAGAPRSSALPNADRLKPLSASSWLVQFTATAAFARKIEEIQSLLSHALKGGGLAELFELALDALSERERKRRFGAGKTRKPRPRSDRSRHIPVEVARQVAVRDGNQCTFRDELGRRCSRTSFLTMEHRHPYAAGGPATVENLCILCSAHNAYTAERFFGSAHISAKRSERQRSARSKVSARRAPTARPEETNHDAWQQCAEDALTDHRSLPICRKGDRQTAEKQEPTPLRASDSGINDSGVLHSDFNDSGAPDSAVTDSDIPNSVVTHPGHGDSAVTDSGIPNSTVNDSGIPNSVVNDQCVRESAASDPGQHDSGVNDFAVDASAAGGERFPRTNGSNRAAVARFGRAPGLGSDTAEQRRNAATTRSAVEFNRALILVQGALRTLGFRQSDVVVTSAKLSSMDLPADKQLLLRAALELLAPRNM